MMKTKAQLSKKSPAKSVSWSARKAMVLRKPAKLPSGGDCNCNCGGK